MKELHLEDAETTPSDAVDDARVEGANRPLRQIPPFGYLLTSAPLEDDDLPTRKPSRLLRTADI